jgi:pilus assembly protein Flp/PilA
MYRFLRNQQGATAIEYGLILALVVLVMVVGLSNLGNSTSGLWGQVKTKAGDAMSR